MVEGTLDESPWPPSAPPHLRPGRLGPLVAALDLPIVAMVPWSPALAFHLPPLPPGVEALLIDGVEEPDTFPALKKVVEVLSGKPVIGGVERLDGLRAELAENSAEHPTPLAVFAKLGASFLRFADLDALLGIARGRSCLPEPPATQPGPRFRVAYAHDEAFGNYFPDTLEALEGLGAELVDFSPLRDETLPENADLVMIGAGLPDRFAEELAGNFSLVASLRDHVCRGHRIYAEGGGAAYLGRSLIVEGRRTSGAGIFPFDAELASRTPRPRPVLRRLNRSGWLGPRGTAIRGYLSGRWRLHPAPEPGDCPARSGPLADRRDMVFRYNAVGSLVHLHLASLPEVVSAFTGLLCEGVISPSGK